MISLSQSAKTALIERYAGKFKVGEIGYGTVRDYCDSCDHLPFLSTLQHDLKDLQRPWTVKATLGLLPVGSRLLEIGAGEPTVASFLCELGYDVTAVDPYDGSGGGPIDFDKFRQLYPKVRLIRGHFGSAMPELCSKVFDGIYSVSVLEHVPEQALRHLFHELAGHLRPDD